MPWEKGRVVPGQEANAKVCRAFVLLWHDIDMIEKYIIIIIIMRYAKLLL